MTKATFVHNKIDKTTVRKLNAEEFVLLQYWLSPIKIAPLVTLNVVIASFFVAVMWEVFPQDQLLTWVAILTGLNLLEVSLRIYIHANSYSKLLAWRYPLAFTDFLVGLVWLCGAWLFYSATMMFFYLFSFGIVALCIAVFQHYALLPGFVRIGFALPLAAVKIYDVSDPLSLARAITIVAIWFGVIWLSVRLHASLRQRLLLISSRDALLNKVAESARELDMARVNEEEIRREAETANLAKSRFLAHSSHDLRQPLHATSLLLETIDDEKLDDQTAHVILRVRQSVEMLAKLFDSLLDLTLLDTGQVPINSAVFDIGSVIKEIGEEFSATALANDVDLRVQSQSVFIYSDITIVRRILQNLVANAIRHAPGKTVTIQAYLDGKELSLEVKDTGVGIDPENQQRIFEEFTRLESNYAAKSQSSLGLGLAIVRRLAKLVNITVSLSSEKDKGSSFRLGPFSIESPPENTARLPEINSKQFEQLSVLVVDDDADTLRATGKLLKKWRLRVILNDGEEPLPQEAPALLICDYELGNDKTGIDFAHQVRQQYSKVVPGLLISGNTSPELAKIAAKEKLPLLHKPVRPAQLKSAILTVLGAPAN